MLINMSWLNASEHSVNIWEDSFSRFDFTCLDDFVFEDPSLAAPVVSGTLDDMALGPDLSHTILTEVAEEYRHPRHWSKEEDDLLGALLEKYGQNWALIANYFPYKPTARVVKRWMLKHNPQVKRSRWTPEEDQLILELFNQHGGNWELMSREFSGRLPDSIKNRFYGTIKKRLNSEQLEKIKIRSVISRRRKKPEAGLEDSKETDLNLQEKSKRVSELYKKMATIEAFIYQTKKDIKQIRDTDPNN